MNTPKFHFICSDSYNSTYVVLYESESNIVIKIELIAKFFKPYIPSDKVVDFYINLSLLDNYVFEKICSDNYEYLKDKFLKDKYKLLHNFYNFTKKEIIKQISYKYDDAKLLSYYLQDNNLKVHFIKKLTILSRKEKIAKLLC